FEAAMVIAAHAYPLVLAAAEVGRVAQHALASRRAVAYPPGVDLWLELEAPLALRALDDAPGGAVPGDLEAMARAMPPRAVAGRGRRPAGPTNILFVGSAEEIARALEAAGFSRARRPTLWSRVPLFWAFVGERSYRRAPVSRLD